jgi:hypothetical protein
VFFFFFFTFTDQKFIDPLKLSVQQPVSRCSWSLSSTRTMPANTVRYSIKSSVCGKANGGE